MQNYASIWVVVALGLVSSTTSFARSPDRGEYKFLLVGSSAVDYSSFPNYSSFPEWDSWDSPSTSSPAYSSHPTQQQPPMKPRVEVTETLSPPIYKNYLFLANSPDELSYASYPEYASYPADSAKGKMMQRAQRACKFLNYDHARFLKSSRNPEDTALISINELGSASLDEFQSKTATYFDILECAK